MATREQLLQALANADAAAEAGDKEAAADARQLAQMLQGMDTGSAQQEANPDVTMEDAGNLGKRFLSSAAFNFGDEAMGGIANLYANIYDKLANTEVGQQMGMTGDSGITGESINKDINITTATQSIRDDLADVKERHGGLAMAADIGGALTGGIAAPAKLLTKAPSTLKGISALAGAEGLAFGLGSGETAEERLKQGAIEGTASAFLGPLAKLGIDQVAKRVKNPFSKKSESMKEEALRLREELDPTLDVEGVKKKAQEFYKVADESGFSIKPEAYTKYKDEMGAWMKQFNIKGKRFPMLGKAISEIKMLENPNYQELQGIKDMLVNAVRGTDKPRQRELGIEMSKSIDNLIESLSQKDVTGGSITDVAESLAQGRKLWARKSQGELLDQMKYKAKMSEAELDLDNFDKALRQQIRPALVNPKKRIAFDEDVVTDLEGIITGNKTQNILRRGAGLSPSESTARGFFPSLGAAGTGIAATGSGYGALLGTIPGLGGGIARKLANRITAKEFDKLQNAVLNKGQLEVNQVLHALMKEHDLLRASASAATSAETGSQLNDLITGQ